MKKAIISPSVLKGEITVPPSKSVLHRAIICAFLAQGKSVIKNAALSKDIEATMNAARAMGADARFDGKSITVTGGCFSPGKTAISCGESGSTLRFLVPVCAALGIEAEFTGEGRLPERPIKELSEILLTGGVSCGEKLPLNIKGKLSAGVYKVRGDISSQYITGLLLALPLCEGNSEIRLISPLQSRPYVDITVGVMKDFGVTVKETENGWLIKGNQSYRPCEFTAEGDWSQGAFFLTAAALSEKSEVLVKGLSPASFQGDKEIFSILKSAGADISFEKNSVLCKGNKLNTNDINASQIPDLVPILSVLMALSGNKCKITGAERLRLKESDRLKAMAEGLSKMGFSLKETDDGIIFGENTKSPRGCPVSGYNDHRIVMAMAVAALFCEGETEIKGAESIEKSYPNFFEDYNTLGGKANVIHIR